MLSVMDDNDNEPAFDAQVYRGTVREGLPAGTRALQGEYRVPRTGYRGTVCGVTGPEASCDTN